MEGRVVENDCTQWSVLEAGPGRRPLLYFACMGGCVEVGIEVVVKELRAWGHWERGGYGACDMESGNLVGRAFGKRRVCCHLCPSLHM